MHVASSGMRARKTWHRKLLASGIKIAYSTRNPATHRVYRVKIGGREGMFDRISDLWCKKMHSQAMWPIHGHYICPKCLREHQVPWEGPVDPALDYLDPKLRDAGIPIATSTTPFLV
jgi:hypothetical protein